MIKHLIIIITIAFNFACSTVNKEFNTSIQKFRTEKKEELIKDQRFPLKSDVDFKGMQYYKANKKYLLLCSFQKTKEAKPFDLPTYSGKTRVYVEYGTITCPIEKETITLSLYQNLTNPQIYKNHLFLPFKDLTSGNETYGGGRYIDMQVGDLKENTITIDFNKCYNPWCAYSDGFNCPIPPKVNHLSIPIKAGEKNYTGTHKTSENH